MKHTGDTEKCINTCNRLLRGELSAVETYNQAIEKHPATSATSELTRIRDEHRQAVSRLTANVREMGGEPDTDSGAWGAFSNAVQGAANLFGAESAVASLQRGEEHGRNDYLDALDSEHVMEGCKNMIRTELLPATDSHIATLERLEEQLG
jgi:uncharacterized protein (TIGR02284 family)